MLPRLLLVYHSRGYVYDYVGNNRSNNSECNFFVKIIIIYGLLISSSRIFHQRLEQKKEKNVEGRIFFNFYNICIFRYKRYFFWRLEK